jgi:hypothetical protein
VEEKMRGAELRAECVEGSIEGISQGDLGAASDGASSQAYVLVETVVGKSLEVSRVMSRCNWANTVERMAGPFDIMVVTRDLAEWRALERIKSLIEGIDGVLRVVVCPLSPSSETS